MNNTLNTELYLWAETMHWKLKQVSVLLGMAADEYEEAIINDPSSLEGSPVYVLLHTADDLLSNERRDLEKILDEVNGIAS